VALDGSRPFFSALLEDKGSFRRMDFSSEAWLEVAREDFHSYWKNKGGGGVPKPAPIDFSRLQDIFEGLEGADDPDSRLLRYLLALILVRRRRLGLTGSNRDSGEERLVLRDRRNGGRILEVSVPEADREELEKARKKLILLLAGEERDPEEGGENEPRQ
jgi:hypothetical protein